MTKAATMFMISDSYTMDDDEEEAVDSSSDHGDAAANSPSSHQQSINNNDEEVQKIPTTLPDEGESSSSPSNNFAEEKKSDSIDRPPSNSGSSDGLDLIMEHDDDDIIKGQQQQQRAQEEGQMVANSFHAGEKQTTSRIIIRQPSESTVIASNNSNNNSNYEQQQQQSMAMKSTTMAMVKLRIWDAADPTKQFKFITATKVLLLPPSQANNTAAADVDNGDVNNNNSNSDETNNKNFLRSNTTSSSRREREHRLSIVKEERHGSSSTLDYDETTTTNNNNTTAAAVDCCDDEEMGEGQQDEGDATGRRGTVKITNQSVKNDYLLQLSTTADADTDGNDDNNIAADTSNSSQLLQVGDLVGIHLKKSTKTISSNSSTPQQQHYQNQEWKVGHPIQLLHNLNLIPLHNNGLELLLQRIEGNDPSLRELILDGITTTPIIEVVTPTSTSTSPIQQQQQSLLSTSQLEILIEAIGTNTSIKKCSLRYSNITDEIASLIALCLVDNTTMTTLSLKGNVLTSSSAKNFYSVLRSSNTTLRVLDLSENRDVDEEVLDALDQFMEQRAVKRVLTLKAERAKRVAKGLPLLNEMLCGEDEDGDDDYRFGSSRGGGAGSRRGSSEYGGGGGSSCCVTLVCHPGIIDGSFHSTEVMRHSTNSSIGSYPLNVVGGTGGLGGEGEEEYRHSAMSVTSDITGIGNDVSSPSPTPIQQQQYTIPESPRRAYYQRQQQQSQQQQQQQQDPSSPYVNQSSRSSNGMFDPNYSMTMSGMMSSSQASSSYEEGNDGSVETATTNATGNNSLDQRQRQQLATLDGNNNNSSNNRHPSSSHRGGGSSTNTTGSTRSHLNLDSSDYIDDKADERELRYQLAKHGQAVGAYAMEEEAPNRQELRGRVNRMSRSESQRRARLAELSRGSGGNGNGGSGVAIPEGDVIDANIERMEDFEYRNLSLYEKGFGKIGLGGTERKMERCICILFTVCCVVLIVAISLFLSL